MMVSSPVGGTIEISRTCSNVEIGELKLVAHDLQVMAMRDIDIILGMNWLTANFATIRCKERQISLQAPGEEPTIYHGISMNQRTAIISALQATAMLRKGRSAYLVYLRGEENEQKKTEDVAIVREFPDVIPEVLPGPPPDRQLEFTIDLEPGAAPVLAVPEPGAASLNPPSTVIPSSFLQPKVAQVNTPIYLHFFPLSNAYTNTLNKITILQRSEKKHCFVTI